MHRPLIYLLLYALHHPPLPASALSISGNASIHDSYLIDTG